MEAIDFLKEYNRMCAVNKDCIGCPLKGTTCLIGEDLSEEQMINIIDKTEQWSKEHPVMTNAQKFEEVFGDKAVYAIISSNTQAIGNWLDEPYKEVNNG